MQAIARDLRRLIDDMPPLPGVAMRVMRVVNDVEFSMEDLVELIRTDPALTTKILNLCNSSLFALQNEISSIPQALSFLGIRNIVRTVVTSCTSNYFKPIDLDIPYLSTRVIWQHSIGCAAATQKIIARVGGCDQGTAYTAGVLHNLGKIALAQLLELYDGSLELQVSPCEDELINSERRVYGIDHAQVTAFVIDRWTLPPDLRFAIKHHHDRDEMASGTILAPALHAADILCLRIGVGHTPEPGFEAQYLDVALQRLGMTPAEIDAIGTEVLEEIEGSAELVNMV